MELSLSFPETRVLGALIEKAITTPDQYPLTLNSLTNACNQKSNREPVVSYEESEVQQAADSLIAKRLVTESSGFGSRVQKYQHRFCNTEFSNLRFSEQELGILCVLFLRGAQTPGELRSRTNRLCAFSDVKEAEVVLDNLASRVDGPFVRKLSREAGKRESRYVHLFCDEEGEELVACESGGGSVGGLEERVDILEEQVRQLQAQIAVLAERLSL
ncbi:YceH family protein [Kistimonas asteriae]|uniref:YceH family protein n=1 Tax=Kistimonas asteriae TaxID=517724 RepID=UPI001BA8BA70|nr:DUF480 domain-containing protein [Kistimonas asteriae]